MIAALPSVSVGRMAMIGPALVGASSFAGGGVLTVSTLRGVIGLAVLLVWLRFAQPPTRMARREKYISLGLGALFAANVFLLFKAIQAIEVAIAILTYFVYPLLTGITAAVLGLEKLSWRGVLTAVTALVGLALMLGAAPAGLALAGVLAALAAACCRVLMLLVTRASLQHANPLMITLYSIVSSTALLAAASLVTPSWQPPLTLAGWLALAGLSVMVMTGILGVFASTVRIGPFRTALFMNLEPLLTAIGGAVFLGELITPLQALGGAVMIAALTVFQLRR
jgi:probable blue pigment (indigoidine) exporter